MTTMTRGLASRRLVATLAATLMACVLALTSMAAPAHAGNRDWLRPDATGHCVWDAVGYWVQRCDVYSPAMQRSIPVLIQPASRGGDAGLYMLDGMRAEPHQSGWVKHTDIAATYAPHNINVIMPIGGAGSFYADWEAPATFGSSTGIHTGSSFSDGFSGGDGGPVIYKWETFLTRELPDYLQKNFGVNPHRNAIQGLSMGGTAALTLAAHHPAQFQQTYSFSGYLTTTAPGMQTLMRAALIDSGGFNINSMYGTILSARRFDADPFWNMERLRNTDVYVSAATGFWEGQDLSRPLTDSTIGFFLEQIAMNSTFAWELKARAQGLNPISDYRMTGIHNWPIWQEQMHKTMPMVLNKFNAW